MSKVIFDGINKRILINTGFTSIDVQIDLYSEWKRWVNQDINLKYLQAFRTFGGDQTISGQFAPRYFFLMNGWRILVDDGRDLLVSSNLYTDELDSPFIVSGDSTVSLNNSDAAVVDKGISESLDYSGYVTINPSIGVSGTNYPVGTVAQPVNNMSDAKEIANRIGTSMFNIHGSVFFDVDLINSTVYGGNIRDIAILQDIDLDGTTFKECVLTGSYTGQIAGETIQIASGLTSGGGTFKDSGIQDTIHISEGQQLSILNCSSMVFSGESPTIIVGSASALNLRKYSGGITIGGHVDGCVSNLEFLAGNCKLLSSNVGGTIHIGGISTLSDESQGTDVLIDGLITPNQKIFGGQIG